MDCLTVSSGAYPKTAGFGDAYHAASQIAQWTKLETSPSQLGNNFIVNRVFSKGNELTPDKCGDKETGKGQKAGRQKPQHDNMLWGEEWRHKPGEPILGGLSPGGESCSKLRGLSGLHRGEMAWAVFVGPDI